MEHRPQGFRTTRWSVVLAAGKSTTRESRAALEHLAESYWYPLYSYVRRRGHGEEEARDLTQAFFALLLERDDLAGAAPERGRFRAFLLTALKHFLVNEAERARAVKRGGGRAPVSIEAGDADTRYSLEPADELTPEKQFERAWARSVLDRTLDRLRAEYEGRGKSELFERLKDYLIAGDEGMPYKAVADELGLSEGAIKVAVHRLRVRYRKALRAEILDTVSDPSEVEDEMRQLFEALG